MKILKMKYSRNGSGCSQPFISVLFQDKDAATQFANCGKEFIATFFSINDNEGCNVDEESIRVQNVKNFEANWRGDWFAMLLPKAIEAYCKKLNTTEISISAACFPDQYKITTQLLSHE